MYKGRCIGRLIDFLDEYCRSDIAHQVIFYGDYRYIELHHQPFALYKWDYDTNIPTFKFLGEHKHYKVIQAELKQRAIAKYKEGQTTHPKPNTEFMKGGD